MTLPFVFLSKFLLFFWILFLEICFKGMLIVQGPAMIRLFNLEMGAKLAVILFSSLLLSYMLESML